MQLKQLLIQNYGPFREPTPIEFESDVTILTGGNDVGKSLVLQLFELVFSKQTLRESQVNNDYILTQSIAWSEDPQIRCDMVFLSNESTASLMGADVPLGAEITCRVFLAPKSRAVTVSKVEDRGKAVKLPRHPPQSLPTLTRVDPRKGPRQTIPLGAPNETEQVLLEIAFGPGDVAKKLGEMGGANRKRAQTRGGEQLTKWFEETMPGSWGYSFDLQFSKEGGGAVMLFVSDKHQGHTPIDARGLGFQALLSIATQIGAGGGGLAQRLIVLDEPETSLHADAQHALRRALERVAAVRSHQVVYATHSPAMVNTMKPSSIRLLERSSGGQGATTIVIPSVTDGNYARVRSSLGISPADSLLFAPITVIIEGKTEVLCLPRLIQRLEAEGHSEFAGATAILSECHFLDGEGDSFELMCRLAKSQGAKPVIFLDGDKARRLKQSKVSENHPDVAIITLAAGQEFEQLVSMPSYFNALAAVLGDNSVTADSFTEWDATAGLPERMLLTKRVDAWLASRENDVIFSKPKVMFEAVARAPLSEIVLEPIEALMRALRTLAERL